MLLMGGKIFFIIAFFSFFTDFFYHDGNDRFCIFEKFYKGAKSLLKDSSTRIV